MKKYKFDSWLASICVCFLVGCATPHKEAKNAIEVNVATKIIIEATTKHTEIDLGALTAIRDNDIINAVELLELKTDHYVCKMWNRLGTMPQDTKDSVLRVLLDIKTYREKYPRKVESSNIPAQQLLFVEENKKEAENILAKLNKQILSNPKMKADD